MALFKFTIWDRKFIEVFEDGQLIQIQHPKKAGWYKKTCAIETDQLRITSWQETELYANEVEFKNCVQVFLTDEDYVFAAYSLEAWEKLYKEVYLPLIPKDLNDIIDDLKGE
jgi:hypothetical protein